MTIDEIRDCIEKILLNHRLQFTTDEDGDGLSLVDCICPIEDGDISRGKMELEYLADSIAYELEPLVC